MSDKICAEKNCKKRTVKDFRTGIAKSKYCPNHYYKRNYEKSRLNPKNKVKKTKIRTPRQRAIDRADEWFSKYVRLKYSKIFNGVVFCQCYTCGKINPIKQKTDNGHYIGRGHWAVRYDERNTRPQCKFCNRHREGMKFEFEQKLIQEIGQSEVDELKKLALTIVNYSTEDIRVIAKKYRIKVRTKEKDLGVKIWN